MVRYVALPTQVFRDGQYRIEPLRGDDMELIRTWRNDQLDVLRQAEPLSAEQQRLYYERAIEPTFSEQHPRQILFSFLHDDRLLGYGGLTNLDWESERAELAFLADTRSACNLPRYTEEFRRFLGLIQRVAFDALGLHRLFTETYDLRPHHVAVLEASGFIPEGRMRDHVRVGGRFVDSLLHGCLRH